MEPVNLWNKALDLLSRREHSVFELKTKLKRFSENASELEDTIKRLKIQNFWMIKRSVSLLSAANPNLDMAPITLNSI